MPTVIRPTRLLSLVCCLAMSACLWRPPIIPPGARGAETGVDLSAPDVRSGALFDAQMPTPSADSGVTNGGEAFDSCDDYSNRMDGATPPDGMLQLRDGYVARCLDSDGDAATSDASTAPIDGALDARPDAN